MYDAYQLAKKQTNERVAPIGASEHHTGYAIDLGILFNGRVLQLSNPNDYNNRIYIYSIIKDFLNDFGFILRYPEDKESERITGYNFEPWHIRYVGKNISKDMEEKNIITLEEYLKPDIYKRGKTIRKH